MSHIDLKKLLDPQMRRIVTYQAESPAYSGSIRDLSSEEARRRYREERATWNADAPELPRIEATTAPGPRREIPLRLYYPEAETYCSIMPAFQLRSEAELTYTLFYYFGDIINPDIISRCLDGLRKIFFAART